MRWKIALAIDQQFLLHMDTIVLYRVALQKTSLGFGSLESER
jgi:hypothetical protein